VTRKISPLIEQQYCSEKFLSDKMLQEGQKLSRCKNFISIFDQVSLLGKMQHFSANFMM